MKTWKQFITEGEAVSIDHARTIGLTLGVNFDEIDINEFRMGLEVEQEHGWGDHPDTDITSKFSWPTYAKIALAHIREVPDYYTKLKKYVENE